MPLPLALQWHSVPEALQRLRHISMCTDSNFWIISTGEGSISLKLKCSPMPGSWRRRKSD